MNVMIFALVIAACALPARGDEVLFHETFRGKLKDGWSWLRENQAGWRVGAGALEIRVEPGNMWGPANDAKNVLVRDLSDSRRPLEMSVTVSNQPTEQYEQVDLVCYYDDSHMVKIGFELVDGKRSIVMGREEKDRTRTIAIIPLEPLRVDLRLIVDGRIIRGSFRPAGSNEWREAGRCDPPARGAPKLSIQCYQGPSKAEHWARISNVTVRALDR
jgi:regulation of enolase protein 1 (concanavalin A-like superfamily)